MSSSKTTGGFNRSSSVTRRAYGSESRSTTIAAGRAVLSRWLMCRSYPSARWKVNGGAIEHAVAPAAMVPNRLATKPGLERWMTATTSPRDTPYAFSAAAVRRVSRASVAYDQ
jgi:hypothetical protein